MIQIVRPGHVAVRRRESPAVSPHGRRRPASTATAQALQTVAALSSRRSGRNVILRPSTATAQALQTAAALSSRRSGRNVILRHSTTIAAIPSSALTIRRPRARTRRRKLIPRRAAATRLRHAPTPHPAAAIAAVVGDMAVVAVVAATMVVEVAEARTVVEVAEARTVVEVEVEARTAAEAAEAPSLTDIANIFAYSTARPKDPDGLFVFRHPLKM